MHGAPPAIGRYNSSRANDSLLLCGACNTSDVLCRSRHPAKSNRESIYMYECMVHVPARTTSHPSESHGKACKMRKTRGTWKLTGLTCTIAETPTKFSSFLVCVQCRRNYCSSNNFYMHDLISFFSTCTRRFVSR